jgi:hypothetical protein
MITNELNSGVAPPTNSAVGGGASTNSLGQYHFSSSGTESSDALIARLHPDLRRSASKIMRWARSKNYMVEVYETVIDEEMHNERLKDQLLNVGYVNSHQSTGTCFKLKFPDNNPFLQVSMHPDYQLWVTQNNQAAIASQESDYESQWKTIGYYAETEGWYWGGNEDKVRLKNTDVEYGSLSMVHYFEYRDCSSKSGAYKYHTRTKNDLGWFDLSCAPSQDEDIS